MRHFPIEDKGLIKNISDRLGSFLTGRLLTKLESLETVFYCI